MKTAGIREARQRLSELLVAVRSGREITLTDRGRPVARIVPPASRPHKPFRSHRKLRASIQVGGPSLTRAISDEREDRI